MVPLVTLSVNRLKSKAVQELVTPIIVYPENYYSYWTMGGLRTELPSSLSVRLYVSLQIGLLTIDIPDVKLNRGSVQELQSQVSVLRLP
jgi:hypothetical protein